MPEDKRSNPLAPRGRTQFAVSPETSMTTTGARAGNAPHCGNAPRAVGGTNRADGIAGRTGGGVVRVAGGVLRGIGWVFRAAFGVVRATSAVVRTIVAIVLGLLGIAGAALRYDLINWREYFDVFGLSNWREHTATLGILSAVVGNVALAPDAGAAYCERHSTTLFGQRVDNSPGPCPECEREKKQPAQQQTGGSSGGSSSADVAETRRAQGGSGDPRSQNGAPAVVPAAPAVANIASSSAPVAAAPVEINHLFAGTVWVMPSNKNFFIAFYRDGKYLQVHGSMENSFVTKWKPGPPTIATTEQATFVVEAAKIAKNGALVPNVTTLTQHTLTGGKYDWVFKGYIPRPTAAAAPAAQVKNKFPTTPTHTASLPNGVRLEMIRVAAGTFTMGSPASERERGGNETQHRVTISQPFYLGKYEVTQAQWVALMGTNPSFTKGNSLPVYPVTRKDAFEFCKRLTGCERMAGRLPEGCVYTLPTEAQWEYACRAGTTSPFAISGSAHNNYDQTMARVGWFVFNSGGQVRPVGQKEPNPWGFYDMHGNAWEMCADWFGDYPAGDATDPTGPVAETTHCVVRGGACYHPPRRCRSARRDAIGVAGENRPVGIRVALVSTVKNAPNATTGGARLSGSANNATGGAATASFFAKPLPTSGALTVNLDGKTRLELVRIPAGTFVMGSPAGDAFGKGGERDRSGNETQHTVTISKPFYLGRYEVTQEQWVALMGGNPSKWKGRKLPVEQVSWNDAVEFCKRLTEQERKAGRLPANYAYQLPTEAQWEYACRAGTKTAFSTTASFSSSGANYNSILRDLGWFRFNSGRQTHNVGEKARNRWGLYDMHGNVNEWCTDVFSGEYPTGSVADPAGSTGGGDRVFRGGSFGYQAHECRSAKRGAVRADWRFDDLGFRVALAPAR
ncbi:MAG: formylglycine-generating enzyme family protein [Puniceicoccales bacterium]|jgi:formylglycine-generating enzyme required for sulfatase activity|nr:formylglycine-generating enzyme family protein [Puniceicoccales bacterium]